MDESSGGGRWWLRSPGNNDKNAANVDGSGWVNDNGNNVNNDNVGIRPASSGSQVCILSRSISDKILVKYLSCIRQRNCIPARVHNIEQGKHWMVGCDYVCAKYIFNHSERRYSPPTIFIE